MIFRGIINIDKGFDLSVSKLLMSKNFKPFKKSQMTKQLYSNLLALFGIEHFYDEKENKEFNHSIQSESFFIRPEKLYEWIVGDNLIEHYQKDIIKKVYAILVYPCVKKNGYFQEYLHGNKSESTFNFYTYQLGVNGSEKINIDEIYNKAFNNNWKSLTES